LAECAKQIASQKNDAKQQHALIKPAGHSACQRRRGESGVGISA